MVRPFEIRNLNRLEIKWFWYFEAGIGVPVYLNVFTFYLPITCFFLPLGFHPPPNPTPVYEDCLFEKIF
jgi:hypothetical protein